MLVTAAPRTLAALPLCTRIGMHLILLRIREPESGLCRLVTQKFISCVCVGGGGYEKIKSECSIF